MVEFSFLCPTRGRPDEVGRFLQSIQDTTARPEELEIIFCVDEDDEASRHITHDRLNVRVVTRPPGTPMGALNRACFEASRGRQVMLINDDVLLRTPGWDHRVAEAFGEYDDGVVLLHTNDLLFREKLCTFPFLTRRCCLEIGTKTFALSRVFPS